MLPTSTQVTIFVKPRAAPDVAAVAIFLRQAPTKSPADATTALAPEDRRAVERLITAGVVRGKARELAFDLVDAGKAKHRRVYAVGVGPAEKVSAETLRQAAGQLARALRKHRLASVAIA